MYHMGLFPEIERAWLSVDSNLFIWKYTDSSDLAFFDTLKEVILLTHLMKPKTGTSNKFIVLDKHKTMLLFSLRNFSKTHISYIVFGDAF